jgi:tyrosine-protein kinase Etk/Wzc
MDDITTHDERLGRQARVPPARVAVGDEISVLDMAIALGEEKRNVFGVALIATLIGLVVSFLLPTMYTSQTILISPQEQAPSSAASALAGLGTLTGVATGAFGVSSPDQMYVGLLHSDAVANRVIDRFKLKERYHVAAMAGARKQLARLVKITSDKQSGFITIAATDRSAGFSAQLANAYVDELRGMLDHLAVTEAQQRSLFFQQQIDKTKDKLSEAEIAFEKAQRVSGVVSLDSQVLGSIKQSADLRAQIAARQVQLQSMRTYATANNPDVLRVAAEIDALRSQLATLERGSADANQGPTDATALANVRAYREVQYQEAQLDAFTKQLELAQVDAAREGPFVQQVDAATPPEQRSSPRRTMIVGSAAVAGLILGAIAAFFRRMINSANREEPEKLAKMRRAWTLHRGKV